MIRLVLYLVAVAALATGMSWLADRPGMMVINWEGYEVETSVFKAVVVLALLMATVLFLWSLLRQLWSSPATLGRYFVRRRHEKGLDALSSGMIAIGAGDRQTAMRYAMQARKALPNEPLTHLLRAQAAQLAGDRTTSRRIFEAMLAQPDTEQLGLRGLFLEAEREGEVEAARQFAERALRINPKLGWPVEALFDLQCREGLWEGALETLAAARKNGHFDKAAADRRRGVLLTAIAQDLEETNGNKALELASEAHALAPDLVPAAAIAGRQLASRGGTAKAAKIIERTWKAAPHPDLALVYAYARPGDSPRDRLERVRRLARMASDSAEGPI
ncbi:MAG: heme biosynthesis protein HemY, partial [Hyphomicrobiaceae bacterium]